MNCKSKLHPAAAALVFAIIGSFLFPACGDDDSPTLPDETAKIEGRVTDDGGFNKSARLTADVEDADVTVSRVQPDGSVTPVSDDTVQTDSEGRFLVEASVDGESGLIVIATKGTDEWRAVVSARAEQGAVVSCQPLNDETTLEASVYLDVVANGGTDRVSYADIAANIDIDVVTTMNAGTNTVSELAAAFTAEAEAHNEILTDASIGATPSQLEAIVIARIQAQATLEAALLAAGNDQNAIDAAFAAFNDAEVNAYTESGLSAEAYAKAREVSAKVLAKNATGLSSETQIALNRKAAERRAIATDKAVQKDFSVLNASETQMSAVIDAGASLRTSIEAATNPTQIAVAFQAYHNIIISELQAVANAYATAIFTINTSINAVTGAKLVLEGSLSTATTTQAVVDAYVTFFGAIETLAEATLTGASAAEVQAISNVMILVNMQV